MRFGDQTCDRFMRKTEGIMAKTKIGLILMCIIESF